jgi:hypothetical protein
VFELREVVQAKGALLLEVTGAIDATRLDEIE